MYFIYNDLFFPQIILYIIKRLISMDLQNQTFCEIM